MWLAPHRRDAYGLSYLQTLLRLSAPPIDAQLALPDDALDVRERQPGEARLQEAVDAHACLVRRHPHVLHRG
jgi:hypothetical protein